MLEISELSKRYGDVVALDGCTFSAAPGQLLGFLGPNGAGKTTAMRAIFSLIRPDRGSEIPILRAASLFPAFSPMTMPLRQARGDVTGLEVALSVGLIMLAIWLVIRLAGRIYTGAALRTGGKVKAREALNSSDL
ncbi:MAG: ATP-binding cassette domain-containing protein [Acidobacteria bacterium]|nr:ATP-binding cassette domain-containing protein [Acidobacteriota bacterium]